MRSAFWRLLEKVDDKGVANSVAEELGIVLDRDRGAWTQYHDFFEGIAVRIEEELRRVQRGHNPGSVRATVPPPANASLAGETSGSSHNSSAGAAQETSSNRQYLKTEYVDRPLVKQAIFTLRLVHGPQGVPVECSIKGATRACLARMILAQPKQHHSWKDLLAQGLKGGYWNITSPASLERTGRRIRDDILPPSLRGYWEQDCSGVIWNLD
ncbi:MAG: hypothetical protein ACKVXR_03890 [Planctomycetota bacterium]